jgi:hypothetical protein
MLFILNIGNWSSTLDSSFVVHGQTAGGNSAPYARPNAGGTILFGQNGEPVGVLKVVPQIAVGSFDGGLTRYTTTVQIVNTGNSVAAVSGNFYKEQPNGAAGTDFPIGFTGNISGLGNPAPAFSNVLIQPNASLVLTSSSNGPGSTGWGKITSTGNISVTTVFEFREGETNDLRSRIGVASSASDMSKFTIARVRNVASVLDVGFALVNTGTTNATVTATLYDSNGVQVGAPRDIVIAGQGHTARFVHELFNLSGEPAGTSYSNMVLSSNSPQWASMALAFEGGNMNSFSVERLE